MLILIIVLFGFGLTLMVFTYFNRRKTTSESEITINIDEECCGAHEVCDKNSLLNKDLKAEYFDDEELDSLAGIDPAEMTKEQIEQLSEVFYTLKESDVAAWLRSLQLRMIQLPAELREQALLIVSERR
ncbi:MAG: phospholipase [Paludibacter sp.]|nr:phospholipase [Paludibacter sp.]